MKKIKSITGYSAFVGEGGIPENEYKSTYQEFDIDQHLIKDMTFTHDGEVETASGYKFNASNVLTEEIHYLNETEVAERLVYQYDKNGEMCEIEKTYADGAQSIKKANRNGQVLTVTILDEDNQLEGEEISIYDEQGNVLEAVIYDENKNVLRKSLHNYDGENQRISTTEFGENEEFAIRKIFEYNNKGQVIKESHYNERRELINVIISKYHEEGELTLQQFGNNYLIKISYDDRKRRVKEETINLSNDLVEALKMYKYDENDFLTERITYDMGQQYALEPGVLGRTGSNYISTVFHYEFYA